jgi:hypothetical protein
VPGLATKLHGLARCHGVQRAFGIRAQLHDLVERDAVRSAPEPDADKICRLNFIFDAIVQRLRDEKPSAGFLVCTLDAACVERPAPGSSRRAGRL